MKPNQLNRIINLVRRTGDTMVVLDQATDQSFVLMNADDYEDLLDERDGSLDFVSPPGDLDNNFSSNTDLSSWDETPAPAAPTQAHPQSIKKNDSLDFSTGWTEPATPPPAKTIAPAPPLEEVNLSDVTNEDEEEKFYLEPVDEV